MNKLLYNFSNNNHLCNLKEKTEEQCIYVALKKEKAYLSIEEKTFLEDLIKY